MRTGATTPTGSRSSGAGYSGDEDMLRQAVKIATPILQKLGFGGVMGACAAYATKVVGRAAAYYVGISFIVLQMLSYPWEFMSIKQEDGSLKPTPFIQVGAIEFTRTHSRAVSVPC